MGMVLDVAAGILLAAAVMGAIALGVSSMASETTHGTDLEAGGCLAVVGVIIGVAIIACRLAGWP